MAKASEAFLALAILIVMLMITVVVGARVAHAHSWYSEKKDPVYGQSCCGGTDCAMWRIEPGELSAEETGYRVRMSLEKSKTINPYSMAPIDAIVIWDRVQPSPDGNWHICIMSRMRENEKGGVYCLFAPPNI